MSQPGKGLSHPVHSPSFSRIGSLANNVNHISYVICDVGNHNHSNHPNHNNQY